jgi:hypothetical protein
LLENSYDRPADRCIHAIHSSSNVLVVGGGALEDKRRQDVRDKARSRQTLVVEGHGDRASTQCETRDLAELAGLSKSGALISPFRRR